MARHSISDPQALKSSLYLWVCTGCFVGLLLVLGLLVWLLPRTALYGSSALTSAAYVMLGLLSAGFLFGAMRAYAHVTGAVADMRFELGGPAAIFFVVAAGGLWYESRTKSDDFDFPIYVHVTPNHGDQIGESGTIVLQLDRPEIVAINQGAGHALGLPTRFRGQKRPFQLKISGYHKAAATDEMQLRPREPAYIQVEKDLPPTAQQLIGFGPQLRLGQYLGLPEVMAEVTITNPASQSLDITKIAAALLGPDGERCDLELINVMLDGGVTFGAIPPGEFKPGEWRTYHYRFFAPQNPGFNNLQQKAWLEAQDRVRPGDRPDPANRLFSDTLTNDLTAFADGEFPFRPGKWKFVLECMTSEGDIRRSAVLQLRPHDIDRMRSPRAFYRSGIGVLVGWQYWQTGPESPVVDVRLEPAS